MEDVREARPVAFPALPFAVQVIADDLNYGSEPSMNGKVNGQTGKGVFPIAEVKDGWGRLKSGAGRTRFENPAYRTVNKPASTSKTTDEPAGEVLKGTWGNGEERKQGLTAACYDYPIACERVNQILKK